MARCCLHWPPQRRGGAPRAPCTPNALLVPPPTPGRSPPPPPLQIQLQPSDTFFLLACDGVWDVMTNQEAVDFVGARLASGANPTDAACALLDACLADDPKEARGVGCDNMTAIVILLAPSGGAAAGGVKHPAQQQG